MPENAASPLELWATSRQLAKQIVTNGPTTDQLDTAAHYTPEDFPAEMNDLDSVFTHVDPDDDVETAQQTIYNHLTDVTNINWEGSPYDNSEIIHSWNDARSAATTLFNWFNNNTDITYADIRNKHGDVVPISANEALELIEHTTGESYNEQHQSLTRLLYERTPDTAQDTETVNDGLAVNIAKDFFACFVHHNDNVSYQSITNKYTDVAFPKRTVAMMKTINSSGSTESERIRDLAQWVQEWVDDPEQVDEINRQGPRPMGMNPR